MKNTEHYALKVLQGCGLFGKYYGTLDRAAEGVRDIILSLRALLRDPDHDLQFVVLRKLGVEGFTQDGVEPTVRLISIVPAALPDRLPTPKALYPCAHCGDEVSRYAEELYWWTECQCWVCEDCWEDESHGEKGMRLDAEIRRQND